MRGLTTFETAEGLQKLFDQLVSARLFFVFPPKSYPDEC